MTEQVLLITGAAQRIGAAMARYFHQKGWRLMLHYRHSKPAAEALALELNTIRTNSAAIYELDLAQTSALPGLVTATIDQFGRLDGLINNASSFYQTPIGSITPEAWQDLLASNLQAPLFLSQAASLALQATHGAIINITDIHAERPLPEYSVYCAAKAGLASLTRSLACELAPKVRVNGIAPGSILWPTNESFSTEEQNRIIAHTPLKRCGSPEDIAKAAYFLLDQATYITGHILPVDGGRSIAL